MNAIRPSGTSTDRAPRRVRAARVGALALAVLVCSALPVLALPPGFAEQDAARITSANDLAFGPDGSLWMIGNDYIFEGRPFVMVQRAGDEQLPTMAKILEGPLGSEWGGHAIAADPDYLENHHVWIYYTVSDPIVRNRLSRFTDVNGTLQNEMPIFESPILQSGFHTGGCLVFASDKTLFLGTGDDAQDSGTAQNPFDVRGKLLHLRRDGTPAPDNPFLDGILGDPRVWATGLRNPYRCNMQPGLDNLFLGDVGAGSWEEVNVGVRGGNYGWATIEGPNPPGVPGFVYPIFAYDHGDPVLAAVIGGDHVPAGAFNPEYEGNYFFGDWARKELRRLVLDEHNRVAHSEVWAQLEFAPSSIKFGPDGSLYYVANNGGKIKKISWVGTENAQPVAVATAEPTGGATPLDVWFDGSGSYDPDGQTLSHVWNFGDGNGGWGEATAHRYSEGVYHARLSVTDEAGASVDAPPIRIVSGNRPPTASIVSPADEFRYNAGDEIFYSGVGDDAEEAFIPCARYTWQVVFHHAGHSHPYFGPQQGNCSGSFSTITLGETAPDTWYEILFTATDTGAPIGPDAALTSRASVEIRPNLSTFTLASAPITNFQLKLDTTPMTAPIQAQGVVNLQREIGAIDPQTYNRHRYRWLSWSDGGSRDHVISTPASDTTFTATFECDKIAEVTDVRMVKAAAGLARAVAPPITLTWAAVPDGCASGPSLRHAKTQYRIYSARSPIPDQLHGGFPDNPDFRLVGTTDDTSYSFVPASSDSYFIVVAVGPDGSDGFTGHYENGPAVLVSEGD